MLLKGKEFNKIQKYLKISLDIFSVLAVHFFL